MAILFAILIRLAVIAYAFQPLQLAFGGADSLDQGATVAKTNLATLDLGDEADFLKLALLLACLPNVCDKLIAGLDGAGETSLVLLDVGRVAAGERADNLEAGRIPRVQAVHDGTAEAHLLAGLGRGMKGVVVAVEAVEEGRLGGGLVSKYGIGLLVLGRRIADSSGALGAIPVALADEEGA
ncbi:hypothetical protein IF2G_01567 [Cordyceps javanica]|nr:hypothetical protein IF2G_01567 [Cordyceps javanica]